ncbi:hypothetical protein P692DRAFT_20862338 [Suillus brevipes Sb2]|nr:hypothetical protein P692DRAFT_20862338 [Suillus brevipes Sb2]
MKLHLVIAVSPFTHSVVRLNRKRMLIDLENQNTAALIKQHNKILTSERPFPIPNDIFEVSAGTRKFIKKRKLVADLSIPAHMNGPCGVIGSTVLLTTLGQDMKSKSTAIATYHVPQLVFGDTRTSVSGGATQHPGSIAWSMNRPNRTSRGPIFRGLVTAPTTLELSLIGTAIITGRLKYGAEPSLPNSASRRTQIFTRFGSTTEGSDLATATISDELITLPSESASTPSLTNRRSAWKPSPSLPRIGWSLGDETSNSNDFLNLVVDQTVRLLWVQWT